MTTARISWSRRTPTSQARLISSGDLAGIIDVAEDGADDVNPESAELKIIWKSAAIAAPPLAVGYFWGFIAEDALHFDGIRELRALTGSSKCSLDG